MLPVTVQFIVAMLAYAPGERVARRLDYSTAIAADRWPMQLRAGFGAGRMAPKGARNGSSFVLGPESRPVVGA